MPLDQSIVFDGAWRVLSGQVPYRDFTTPSGLTTVLLQVPFFALLGPTWLAYCLHAALVNGLFGVLVLLVLRELGMPLALSLGYALASQVLLYPPMGTPYLEQHAFFFLLLACLLLLRACRTCDRRRARVLAALVPPVLLLTFFSKQNVLLFGLLPLLAIVVLAAASLARLRLLLAAGLASTAVVGVVMVGIGALLGMDPVLAFDALLRLPARTGGERVLRVDRVWRSVLFLSAPQLALAAALLLVPAIAVRARGARRAGRAVPLRPILLPLGLALALIATCLLFLATTKNHPASGCPYFFLALGATHQALRALLPEAARRPGEVLVGLVCGVVVLLDAWTFFVRIDVTRVVNDLTFRPWLAAAPRTPELSFLLWQTPQRSAVTAAQLDRLVALLRERDGSFFLLGDSSILHALTGRPSLSPSLWYHPGLTFPAPGSEGFAEWDAEIARRLVRDDVRRIVLEGPETWMRVKLDDVPSLARAVRERGGERTRIGPFTVIELRG